MAQPIPGVIGMGSSVGGEGSPSATVANIMQALEIIHSRTTTNEVRHQASQFLESQKHEKSAVENGYLLAAEQANSPLVRHYGLSLLEHVLKHQSGSLPVAQTAHLRGLVLELAQRIQAQDPSYIRNKIVSLWVEIAKRTWGLDWMDMDEAMVQLWNGSLVLREFVLSVLETLSEDIIHHEDTVSSLRGTDLNRALVEVCTPSAVYKEIYPDRDQHPIDLRCGPEGWLLRVSSHLNDCIPNVRGSNDVKACAIKALAALRSIMAWSIPRAILSAQCVPTILSALTCEDEEILMVSAMNQGAGRFLLILWTGCGGSSPFIVRAFQLRHKGLPGPGQSDLPNEQPCAIAKAFPVVGRRRE
jgi:exportin-5